MAAILTRPALRSSMQIAKFGLFSGNLRDNDDFLAAFTEIAPIYKPPGKNTAPASGPQDTREDIPVDKLNYRRRRTLLSYNLPRFDVRSRLAEITAPTIVIVGRLDPFCTPTYAEEISNGVQTGSWLSSRIQAILLRQMSQRHSKIGCRGLLADLGY